MPVADYHTLKISGIMNEAEIIGSAIALAPDTALWRVWGFDAFLLVFLVGSVVYCRGEWPFAPTFAL
jgi:hypothetical protein